MRPPARDVAAVSLPLTLLATMMCALVFVAGQQALRSAADDPQLALAHDAAASLDAGATPASVVAAPVTPVDVATSLAPFTVVFDETGTVLATDGRLDGAEPVPPIGVLQDARDVAPDANVVTWQPRPGVRIASVTVAWSGGTVLVGRSLREVERRIDRLLALVAVAWAAMLVAILAASAVAVSLWRARAEDGPAG